MLCEKLFGERISRISFYFLGSEERRWIGHIEGDALPQAERQVRLHTRYISPSALIPHRLVLTISRLPGSPCHSQ